MYRNGTVVKSTAERGSGATEAFSRVYVEKTTDATRCVKGLLRAVRGAKHGVFIQTNGIRLQPNLRSRATARAVYFQMVTPVVE